jgi:hypothetical protein
MKALVALAAVMYVVSLVMVVRVHDLNEKINQHRLYESNLKVEIERQRSVIVTLYERHSIERTLQGTLVTLERKCGAK